MKKFEITLIDPRGSEDIKALVVEEETWCDAMARYMRYLCRLQGISEDTPFHVILGGNDPFKRFYDCEIECKMIDNDYVRSL